MNKELLFLTFCLNSCYAMAQMPETDIFLINYLNRENELNTTDIEKISNGIGYNNQPSFSPDCSKIYFTSNVTDGQQTDLFAYDIASKQSQRLSNVDLSEYSPMIRPNYSFGLSHIRVESDKKQHLRYYERNYDSSINLVPCSDSIGYYIWSDSSNLGLIILNNGLEFHTYKLGDTNTKLISNNVGRFINYDKNANNYLFIKKDSTSITINYFDLYTGVIKKSIPALTDCEDYAIDINSEIYGGHDGKIFRFSNNQWLQVADLSKQLVSFYRMSFCNCGKHLCVVSYKGKKP